MNREVTMVRVTQVLEAHVLGEADWIAASELERRIRRAWSG